MGNKAGEGIKAPCRAACPAGVDVPRYIRHIKEGKFDLALSVIRESIPFPAVCGYACVHPCEGKCARQQYDEPVAIRLLKRAAFEEGGGKWKDRYTSHRPTGKRVAIVGSGPSGLTAAYYLAGKGHEVTVFEALPSPGGMLRYGIPGYRLPNEVVDREIDVIRKRGVEIKTNSRVDFPEKILDLGYNAVVVASGAWRGINAGVETDNGRVLDGVTFLKRVNSGASPETGERVVVVGGGNTAVDSARSALRLGAREAVILYRRTRAEMPASPEEVSDALEEGVQMQFSTAPVKILEDRVLCVKTSPGPVDGSGRPTPVPLEGSEFPVRYDTLIVAAGQSAEGHSLGLPSNADGTVKVDDGTLATGIKAVFAAGDAVTGPSSIIRSIAQGKQAAASVDKYLGGSGKVEEAPGREKAGELTEEAPRGSVRPEVQKLPPQQRLGGFSPVESGYDAGAAVSEARRCLSCDLRDYNVTVDFSVCKECGYCREVCGLDIFKVSGSFNPSGYKPMVAACSEKCVGCLRCLMVCPDFAISIQPL